MDMFSFPIKLTEVKGEYLIQPQKSVNPIQNDRLRIEKITSYHDSTPDRRAHRVTYKSLKYTSSAVNRNSTTPMEEGKEGIIRRCRYTLLYIIYFKETCVLLHSF